MEQKNELMQQSQERQQPHLKNYDSNNGQGRNKEYKKRLLNKFTH